MYSGLLDVYSLFYKRIVCLRDKLSQNYWGGKIVKKACAIPKKFKLPALDDLKDVFSTYKAVENDGESQGLKVNKDHLVNVQNGDFIKYKNVNFADGTANGQKPHVLSMSAQVTSLTGGAIEVRLDDPIKGKVVGTMDVPIGNDP
jgi:glucuronoarabinoxylan endo-1,4-beta-xylanase